MGDLPRSPTTDFYGILGIAKTATIKEMCRAYKSLVMKWHPDRNPSNKVEADSKFREINEAYKALNMRKIEEKHPTSPEQATTPSSGISSHHHKSMDESFFSRPSVLLKSLSRKSHTATTTPTSAHAPNITPLTPDRSRSKSTTRRCASETEFPDLSRSVSRRSPSSNPIIYSQSTAKRKPPVIGKKLECTLEELCHGCVKEIMITRDVIKHGIIEQDEEMVKIKVKPGWKKGTKITFERMGDERPGYYPADIVFLIEEKRHPLFIREGDDLEYGVEIPLVHALTGFAISVPLLGGEKMSLSFDDVVVYPGYEKVIRGQGMPVSIGGGLRGNLRIKFLIDFPTQLRDQSRSLASRILQDCSY